MQDHNYKKCAKHSTAIAAHKVFPGRDHYTCGEPGWEAVADFALDWALNPIAGELESVTETAGASRRRLTGVSAVEGFRAALAGVTVIVPAAAADVSVTASCHTERVVDDTGRLPPEPVGRATAEGTLYGRERELDVLANLVRGLTEGAGGALVVRGEAGIGKSSLLAAAAGLAGQAAPRC